MKIAQAPIPTTFSNWTAGVDWLHLSKISVRLPAASSVWEAWEENTKEQCSVVKAQASDIAPGNIPTMNIREKFPISTTYNHSEGQSFCKIFTYWIQKVIWNRGWVGVILFLILLHKHPTVSFPWAVSDQPAQAFRFARRSVIEVCRLAFLGRENWNTPGSQHLHKHSLPAALEM